MNIKICPKCGHKRAPHTAGPDYECPACGVIYAKFLKASSCASGEAEQTPTSSPDKMEPADDSHLMVPWLRQRPSQIAVALIALILALLFTVWFGDRRTAPSPVLSVKSSGVADPVSSQSSGPSKQSGDQLRDAINDSTERVAQLQSEYDKYSGGLIRALLGSALAAEKHTFAMLKQKQESWVHRIALDYTVDGTTYRAPVDAEEQIAAIESEIDSARTKLSSSQAEADRYSGGLIRATLLSAIATQQMSLAMLEQKRASLKFGFPLYAVNSESSSGSLIPSDSSPAKRELDWSIVKIESRVTESNNSWHKYAWRLEIRNNEEIPLTFNATIEFQDGDGFVIDDDSEYGLYVAPNSTKTFTGSTLIRVPGAYKVAKTNAKVGLK